MKILLTVDPEIPVPPKLYGGIERIVSGLARAYTQSGHEVFLLANPESTEENAKVIFGWRGLKSNRYTDIYTNTRQLYWVCNKIKPDIIHSFSRLLYLFPLFLRKKIPVLQSYQREISKKTTGLAQTLAKERLKFSACGAHMFQGFPNQKKWLAIHNFTDTDFFVPEPRAIKQFLFFLGRIEDIKGTYEAIQVALKTQTHLIIAGNIPDEQKEYYETKVKPFLANPLIEYVGMLNDHHKKHYLQAAKALLFPIKWSEPFGIVMAEAMACGTPVIAFNHGAVNEVIIDGVNGYKVDNLEQMVDAVLKIDDVDRNLVRLDAEARFSLFVIAEKYLKVLTQMSEANRC